MKDNHKSTGDAGSPAVRSGNRPRLHLSAFGTWMLIAALFSLAVWAAATLALI